jgi:tetratricopeptide (TPR) repeat protein
MAGSTVKVEYKDTKTNKGFDAYVENDGKFEVGFTKFPVGIVVTPKIGYTDYMTMNTFEVDNVKEYTVTVKMCKAADVNPLRAIFYGFDVDKRDRERDKEMQTLREQIAKLQSENAKLQSDKKELIAKNEEQIQSSQNEIEDVQRKYDDKVKMAEETSWQASIAQIEFSMLKNDPAYMTYIISENFDNRERLKEEGITEGNDKQVRENFSLNTVIKNKNTEEILKQNEINKRQLLSDIRYQKILGDYDSAIIYYTYIIDNIETDNRYKFLYNYETAELCYLINDFQKANSFINAALELQNYVNQKYLVKTYNLSGKIKNAINENKYHDEYQKAINIYKQFKKDGFEDSEVEKQAAISYTLLGDYFTQKGKNESAKANYHKALDIYTELNKIKEFEVEAQLSVLLKLATIYDSENKKTMVDKCFARIDTLEKKDSQIALNPKINLQRAIYYMQNGNFSDASKNYTNALNYYKTNNSNQNQQEIIETLFLTGLNQFYAKSYNQALSYFKQANDSLSEKNRILLRQTDFVRLKALSMAAIGIVEKKLGDKKNGLKEEGLKKYSEAIKYVKDEKLNKNDENLLLKNMEYLKKYSKLKTVDIIIKIAVGSAAYGLLFIPLIL